MHCMTTWKRSVPGSRKDPLYDEEAERERLERIARVRMLQLEEQRMQVLSPGFDPHNDWWGSAVE